MNILFLTRRIYPDVGGVEKHVLEISKELVRSGNSIIILSEMHQTISPNDKFFYQSHLVSDRHDSKSKKPVKSSQIEYLMGKNIKVIRFPVGKDDWFKKFRIWTWFFKNLDILKTADVVHCHDVFFWYLPFRFLFPNKKVFTTFHGYESYPIKKKAIIVRKISEILSSGNICVGDFMKKWYFAKPDYVIYGGVHLNRKTKQVKSPTAVFFGRLDEQTGVIDYIKAAELLNQKIPGFKLQIFGDGPLRKGLRVKVNEFDSNIDKKLNKYRYIFVSRYLSMLEAFAAKRMVFALYDNPLKRDYLEMSPFKKYINIVYNPQDLASSVQKYYTNTKIERKQIEAAYEWTKTQTWENVTHVYLKLWGKY